MPPLRTSGCVYFSITTLGRCWQLWQSSHVPLPALSAGFRPTYPTCHSSPLVPTRLRGSSHHHLLSAEPHRLRVTTTRNQKPCACSKFSKNVFPASAWAAGSGCINIKTRSALSHFI